MTAGQTSARSVLLVEDSMIIALDTEECLLGLGAERVAVHGTVAAALAAIEAETFDLALLDHNLGSESSEPVAEELRRRAIPFWLATGYGEMADRIGEIGAQGLLVKPFGRTELVQMMSDFESLAAKR